MIELVNYAYGRGFDSFLLLPLVAVVVSNVEKDLEVFVLDTETTGLDGWPKDHVVDVAVCRVLPFQGIVQPVMSSIVGHDTTKWPKEQQEAWIFQKTDLTLEMVQSAPPEDQISKELQSLLSGRMVTSFNVQFDFDKFLFHPPWCLREIVHLTPCLMLRSAPICKLPGLYDDYKWPRLQQAYDMIVGGDPAKIGGEQKHRALEDALMASYILIELVRRQLY
ncbi:MAG: hypothetical protein PWQ88_1074 [Candidatus Methanomethylophilaceae archaeon]|nr:hypothetical protein [Candidatus Methanomethylophilaceae archaeon]MDI3542187.1 hypothetical protein [Candidatus Methanomethylophilaceae archaeon]